MSQNTVDLRKKYTHHVLLTYATHEAIQSVLDFRGSKIKHYAYALHDRDVKEDGSPKVPHTHLILVTNNGVYPSTVEGWFELVVDEHGQKVTNRWDHGNGHTSNDCNLLNCYDYLTHANAPEKFAYSSDIIRQSDGLEAVIEKIRSDEKFLDEKVKDRDKSENYAWNVIQAMLSRVPTIDMCRIYGRDFVYHITQYERAVAAIREEQNIKDAVAMAEEHLRDVNDKIRERMAHLAQLESEIESMEKRYNSIVTDNCSSFELVESESSERGESL